MTRSLELTVRHVDSLEYFVASCRGKRVDEELVDEEEGRRGDQRMRRKKFVSLEPTLEICGILSNQLKTAKACLRSLQLATSWSTFCFLLVFRLCAAVRSRVRTIVL